MTEETSPLGGTSDRLEGLSPERRALLSLRLARRSGGGEPAIRRRPRGSGDNVFPAASGQERLYFLHRLDPDSRAYLVPIALRLRGDLDVAALRASLAALVERHEVLRTSFTTGPAGAVVQVVHPAEDAVVDLPYGETRADEVGERVESVLRLPFDLGAPPLLRAAIWRIRGAETTHVLAICVHHIVVDGWSLQVLVDELAEIYRARSAGREPVLPDLPVQYSDFAAWQREWLDGDALAGHLAFWREELAGVSPVDVPGDRPRPETQSFAGSGVAMELSPRLTGRLAEIGRSERATPFMVLLAGLSVVLNRWTGRSDLVVGTPVAGRSLPELEPLVGFFVNTLPLRIRLDGVRTFRDLLRRTRATCLAATAHQEVPFERIVREVDAERHGGRSSLVQVMLGLDDARPTTSDLHGITSERMDLTTPGAHLDLSVELAPTAGGGLAGWVVYSSDLYDRPTVERFAESLRAVFEAIVADAGAPVAALPVMGGAQRHRVVAELSGAGVPGYAPATVLELFAARVLAAPDAPALRADRPDGEPGTTMSYRALDERADRLARWLRGRGVRPEDLVGVCLERGPELIVAILGVLRAGAAFLPLDPGLPDARLHDLERDARPRLVLCSADTAGRVGGEAVRIDAAGSDPAAPGDGDLPVVDPANAACVLYTSGSTGSPKGVVLTHQGLANRIRRMGADFGFGAGDDVLYKTPAGFDPSLWEMFVPLVTGGTIVVAEPGRHGDAAYLRAVIGRQRITACDFVPSMLRVLLSDPAAAEDLSSLRLVMCGGEELPVDLAERFRRLLPHVALYNLYGPTETTIDVCYERVTDPSPPSVPIGTPVPGNDLYVLDEHGGPLPVGVAGELHIGGAQLARGYLGRPGQTAERFVPHPFRSGGRLYRTGDRARWRPDGTLEYLGRLDRQIKIRGHRVEPSEVETALRAHPEVDDAAVLARRGPNGEPGLVAYVVPPAEPESLRRFLAGRLPAAMVPASYVGLDAFPLTSSGKVDRARLPGTEPAPPARARPEEPADPLQKVLAGIWAETLELDAVDPADDFFELGGHSLLATTIAVQVRDLFRFELPLGFFVESPTVARLAGVVREHCRENGADADRIAELILQVEEMPAEEIEARLQGLPGSSG